jgi:multidrug efflux system outer membrane protein
MHKGSLLALFASLALAGCSLWTGYQKPVLDTPTQWSGAPAQGVAIPGGHWWTLYGDAAIDQLVDEALAHNRDLALAAARVDEARALLRITDAERMPSVDASAGANRSRSPGRSAFIPPTAPLTKNDFSAALNVAYEADLWGRLRGASTAARAQLFARQAARDTVRIALTSQVAQSYYALIALDAQIAVTRRTIELRSTNLGLQQHREKAGLTTEFTLRQLEAEVAAARAQLPALEQRRTSVEAGLSVLLGRSARAITNDTIRVRADTSDVAIAVVPEGLPSELLLRPPNVVPAEQTLAAANARIGVARASLFPRIALTGYLGFEQHIARRSLQRPGAHLAARFRSRPADLPGRTSARRSRSGHRARKTGARAIPEDRAARVRRSPRVAGRAIANASGLRSRERARAALRATLRLARIRYDNGLTSQLEVIDAERNLLQAELNRADALRAQRAAVADVVRALGGGWAGREQSQVNNTERSGRS